MKKDDIAFSRAERIIIRNQRLIMLALANLCANGGGAGADAYQSKLRCRVQEMEAAFEWIASPSERI